MCELLSVVSYGTKFGWKKNELCELFQKEQQERTKNQEMSTPVNKNTFQININIEEMLKEALTSPPVEL